MSAQPLVALDIGSTKVACAIGLPHEQAVGFELLGSSLVPYPGLTDAWLSDPLMVGRTIEQALDQAGGGVDYARALVAVNHPSLRSEHVRVGIALADEPVPVRGQDLKRLQTAALHQVLSVDREPLLVERLACTGNGFEQVRDPRGLPATRLIGTFHVVTLPLAARRAIIQAVESAGMEVFRMSYSLPAVAASAGEGAADRRLLVLDIGGLAIDIGLVVEGQLQALEVLPWGGETLKDAIARQLHVTHEQALTWSLEGTGCRKPEVRAMLEERWGSLQEPLARVTAGQPRPDAVLVGGRAALADGFAEWVERITGIPTSLCRSPRAKRLGELAHQTGLSTAIGVLDLATRVPARSGARSSRLFDRMIDRTRTILTEYF